MLAALKVLRPATRPTPVDLARGQRGGIEFFSFVARPPRFQPLSLSLSLSLSPYFCFFFPPALVSLFSAGGIFGLASDSRAASLKKKERERERERKRAGDEDRAPSLLRGERIRHQESKRAIGGAAFCPISLAIFGRKISIECAGGRVRSVSCRGESRSPLSIGRSDAQRHAALCRKCFATRKMHIRADAECIAASGFSPAQLIASIKRPKWSMLTRRFPFAANKRKAKSEGETRTRGKRHFEKRESIRDRRL